MTEYYVNGYYADNDQLWATFVTAATPVEAAKEAAAEIGEDAANMCVVGILEIPPRHEGGWVDVNPMSHVYTVHEFRERKES